MENLLTAYKVFGKIFVFFVNFSVYIKFNFSIPICNLFSEAMYIKFTNGTVYTFNSQLEL